MDRRIWSCRAYARRTQPRANHAARSRRLATICAAICQRRFSDVADFPPPPRFAPSTVGSPMPRSARPHIQVVVRHVTLSPRPLAPSGWIKADRALNCPALPLSGSCCGKQRGAVSQSGNGASRVAFRRAGFRTVPWLQVSGAAHHRIHRWPGTGPKGNRVGPPRRTRGTRYHRLPCRAVRGSESKEAAESAWHCLWRAHSPRRQPGRRRQMADGTDGSPALAFTISA